MKDLVKDATPKDLLTVPDPSPTEKRALSRAWAYEVPLAYGALFLFQRFFFPERPGFYDVNPNPVWAGILLFGLRYGLGAGLASGALSALTYALGLKAAGLGYMVQDNEVFVRLGMMLVTGAAVGGATGQFIHRAADLKTRIGEQGERIRGLTAQILAQQRAQMAVEQQVVSQMSSIVTLYHGSKALGALDRGELYTAVLGFFKRALNADKASLFLPEDGGWTLAHQEGWQDSDAYPKRLGAGQGLIGRAAAEGKVLSLKEFFETDASGAATPLRAADALMAAPLRAPTGETLAVFSVQTMPLLHFNSSSINLLSLLAEWGDEALAKCIHFETLRSRSILDEDFGVYSAQYLESRSRQEFSRSKRYSLPLSLVLLAPRGLEDAPVAKQVAYLHALVTVLKASTREGDVLTKSPYPGTPFAVLLVTTSRAQAETVRGRILAAHAKLGLPFELRTGLGSYDPTMQGYMEIHEEATRTIQ